MNAFGPRTLLVAVALHGLLQRQWPAYLKDKALAEVIANGAVLIADAALDKMCKVDET